MSFGFNSPERSNDRTLFNQVVSSGDAGLDGLIRQNPDRLYVKEVVRVENEWHVDPTDGRTVYLKLTEPFGDITELRLKGVRIRRGTDGQAQGYHAGGRGYVPIEMSVKEPGKLLFQKRPGAYKAFGGASLKSARHEYDVLVRLQQSDLRENADRPLGVGIYQGVLFQEQPLAFAVIGMHATDRRFEVVVDEDLYDGEAEYSLAFFRKDYEQHYPLEPVDEDSLIHSLGVLLRRYHDAGYYHHYPHFAKFGIKPGTNLKQIKPEDLVIRDLGSTVERAKLEGAEAEQIAKLAAMHRWLDVTKSLRYLRRDGREPTNLMSLERKCLQG